MDEKFPTSDIDWLSITETIYPIFGYVTMKMLGKNVGNYKQLNIPEQKKGCLYRGTVNSISDTCVYVLNQSPHPNSKDLTFTYMCIRIYYGGWISNIHKGT